MKIMLNGESREAAEGLTLAALLASLRLSPDRLAVEVNLQIVPRGRHAEYVLQEGDRLEVVTFAGGG